DRSARKKIADEVGISEKTLRNRIADLKRFKLITDNKRGKVKINLLGKSKSKGVSLFFNILKHIRFIIFGTFIAMMIAAGISLIMPKTYEATAQIFSPKAEEVTSSVSMLMQGLTLGGFGVGASVPEVFVFTAILKSRTMMDSIVNAFDLEKEFHAGSWEEALSIMRSRINVKVTDEGTLFMRVIDVTTWFPTEKEERNIRNRVIDMADYLVRKLDHINIKRKAEEAHNYRVTIEARYKQNLDDLHSAEEAMKVFTEQYGVYELSEQTKNQISAATTIYTNLVNEEVKLQFLQNSLENDNPQIQIQQKVVDTFKEQFDKLIQGKSASDIFLNFTEVPELSIQLVRLKREIEIQSELFKFLTQQLEDARLRERKETPTLLVLDYPKLPEKRIKPKRTVMVLMVGVLTAIMLVFLIAIKESFTDPDSPWHQVINNLTK
ncbi:MAG: hypothetical protein H8D45_26415, partial [Bacteroidetes bacterium]|nr:hypothetical protein [Bacteroidota bacterium]